MSLWNLVDESGITHPTGFSLFGSNGFCDVAKNVAERLLDAGAFSVVNDERAFVGECDGSEAIGARRRYCLGVKAGKTGEIPMFT